MFIIYLADYYEITRWADNDINNVFSYLLSLLCLVNFYIICNAVSKNCARPNQQFRDRLWLASEPCPPGLG